MLNEGHRLIAEINETSPPPGTLAIWYLGQSGFVVKGEDTVVYLDPYLSDYLERFARGRPEEDTRRFRPPLGPDQVTNADLVLGSHLHYDHIDPDAITGIARHSPKSCFVVPAIAKTALVDWGIPETRILTPEVDRPLNIGKLRLTSIPAAHETLERDPRTGYPCRGYIVRLNGVTLYHSGDCVPYDGLVERLTRAPLDIAMLPINGRDYFRLKRGFAGNFTYREAAELAATANVQLLIPMHFGMHAANSEHPGYLVDYLADNYPRQRAHIMVPGERIAYIRVWDPGAFAVLAAPKG